MDKISPFAWAAIAFIVIIAVLVNAWMIALLRNKDLPNRHTFSKRPPRGLRMDQTQKMVRLLRNPFLDEQNQLQQLSHLVQNLHEHDKDPLDPP